MARGADCSALRAVWLNDTIAFAGSYAEAQMSNGPSSVTETTTMTSMKTPESDAIATKMGMDNGVQGRVSRAKTRKVTVFAMAVCVVFGKSVPLWLRIK